MGFWHVGPLLSQLHNELSIRYSFAKDLRALSDVDASKVAMLLVAGYAQGKLEGEDGNQRVGGRR